MILNAVNIFVSLFAPRYRASERFLIRCSVTRRARMSVSELKKIIVAEFNLWWGLKTQQFHFYASIKFVSVSVWAYVLVFTYIVCMHVCAKVSLPSGDVGKGMTRNDTSFPCNHKQSVAGCMRLSCVFEWQHKQQHQQQLVQQWSIFNENFIYKMEFARTQSIVFCQCTESSHENNYVLFIYSFVRLFIWQWHYHLHSVGSLCICANACACVWVWVCLMWVCLCLCLCGR